MRKNSKNQNPTRYPVNVIMSRLRVRIKILHDINEKPKSAYFE